MPIFEYKCQECASEFEELILRDEVPTCPFCKSANTTRLLSCASLHMPAPSRVGQTVTFPKSSRSGCNGCSGKSCSTCK